MLVWTHLGWETLLRCGKISAEVNKLVNWQLNKYEILFYSKVKWWKWLLSHSAYPEQGSSLYSDCLLFIWMQVPSSSFPQTLLMESFSVGLFPTWIVSSLHQKDGTFLRMIPAFCISIGYFFWPLAATCLYSKMNIWCRFLEQNMTFKIIGVSLFPVADAWTIRAFTAKVPRALAVARGNFPPWLVSTDTPY